MTGFDKAVLSATLATVVLVAGHARADTDSFNFDAIEVEEQQDQAIIAMDVPSGSEVKAIDNPERGEMTVTFTGVSVRLPKRVHAGGTGAILSSVDVEPWFIDGQRVTRMVIRYPEGAQAAQDREGDILMVTVDAPEGARGPRASAEAATEMSETDAARDEMAGEDEQAMAADEEPMAEMGGKPSTDATASAPAAWSPAPAISSSDENDDQDAEASMQDTAPEELPDVEDEEMAQASHSDAMSANETSAAADEEPSASARAAKPDANPAASAPEVEQARAASQPVAQATAPASQPAAAQTAQASAAQASAPQASAAQASAAKASAAEASAAQAQPMPAAAGSNVPVPATRTGWYGENVPEQVEATNDAVKGWPADDHQDMQPELPDMDAGPTITIDLQGADVRTVLRSLSETSGWNIVANADVTGEVSLKLDNVPWRRALAVVLKTRSLGYVVEDGIIRVAKADALRAEVIARETAARRKDELIPLETRVVPVRFAAAGELLTAVESLLSGRGKIKQDARTNALVATDIPSVLDQVAALVQQLDGRTPQVEIVAKLVDIDVSAVREMGINWGLNNLHSTQQAISANAAVNSQIGQSAGTVNFGVIREFGDLDLTLQALEQNQKANIISNPKITTVNNREARILVGQEIPLIVQDEAGNPITELKKIGIELRVTPYINQDGLITLDLHPEVSDLASQSTAQGGVIINTSEADTRVMVANGETAVIGGLIRSNETEFKSGVPILHRLPIIGGLFGSETKANAKRELVIFVTPRIIE